MNRYFRSFKRAVFNTSTVVPNKNYQLPGVRSILTDELGMKRVTVKFVTKLLIEDDQIENRIKVWLELKITFLTN